MLLSHVEVVFSSNYGLVRVNAQGSRTLIKPHTCSLQAPKLSAHTPSLRATIFFFSEELYYICSSGSLKVKAAKIWQIGLGASSWSSSTGRAARPGGS